MTFRSKQYLYFVIIGVLCCIFLLSGCSSHYQNVSSSENQGNLHSDNEAGTSMEEIDRQSEKQEVNLVRIGWQDSGFPSPFAFSPSGPGGFLRNSFLFDTLTWKDDTGVIPWLAKSWEVSEDGLTYTFELEQGVQWHDGQPFTAEDVVFSFDYYQQYPFNWTGDVRQIESVKKTGEHMVAFQLKNKYAPFLSDLVGIVPIIPKHVWENVGNPVEYRGQDALIGTGPYKLKKYDEKAGQYLFEANENFFKGKVMVKQVAYLNVSDRSLALQNGEIDGGMTYNYSEVEELQSKGFHVIQSNPTGSAVRMTFNLEHPQLSDKRLRQAIAYALDREDMARKLTGGEPMVGNAGIIPPDSPWYNSAVKQYDYHIEKANQLLDELGYTKNKSGVRNGLKLNVIVSSTSQEAQVIQEMLKKVGIELSIQQVDAASFSTAMGENRYDIAITGHIGLSGDPDFLRLWFLGEASNSFAARGETWQHARFQELATQQMAELDPDKRKEMIDEMQEILAEELPTLVLYHRPFYFVYDANIFDGWKNTYGGIADGIPLWDNKAFLIDVEK